MANKENLSAEEALKRAEKAAADGDKEKAMNYYEAVLIKYPNHEEAMDGVRRLNPNALLRADLDELEDLMKNNKIREAEVRAKMFLELYPEVYDLRKIVGGAMLVLGKHKEATPHLEKAIELMPFCVESHFNLANCYHATGNVKDAIRTYLKTIELKDDLVPAYNGLGNLFMSIRDYDGAYDAFMEAYKKMPMSPIIMWNVGRALMGKAEYGEAIRYIGQAVELDDTKAEMYLDLAMSHKLFGEINEARIVYEVLAAGPDHPLVSFHYGSFLEETDDQEGAIEQFSKAIDITPDFVPAYQRLSAIYKKNGDEDKAKEILQKAEDFMQRAEEHPAWPSVH